MCEREPLTQGPRARRPRDDAQDDFGRDIYRREEYSHARRERSPYRSYDTWRGHRDDVYGWGDRNDRGRRDPYDRDYGDRYDQYRDGSPESPYTPPPP